MLARRVHVVFSAIIIVIAVSFFIWSNWNQRERFGKLQCIPSSIVCIGSKIDYTTASTISKAVNASSSRAICLSEIYVENREISPSKDPYKDGSCETGDVLMIYYNDKRIFGVNSLRGIVYKISKNPRHVIDM